MNRDYSLSSPSLDGILRHDSIAYDGLRRPEEIIRAYDRPGNNAGKGGSPSERMHELSESPENRKILHDYFNDLYGLFMRKMGQFIMEEGSNPDTEVKLTALLQELIKIKKLLTLEV